MLLHRLTNKKDIKIMDFPATLLKLSLSKCILGSIALLQQHHRRSQQESDSTMVFLAIFTGLEKPVPKRVTHTTIN